MKFVLRAGCRDHFPQWVVEEVTRRDRDKVVACFRHKEDAEKYCSEKNNAG